MKINPTLPTATPFSKNGETVNQTPSKGEISFTLYQVSGPILTKVVKLRSLLDNLYLKSHPPTRPAGWIGGPETIPLFLYREGLEKIQKYFDEIETPRSDDQLLVKEINNLLNAFVPAFKIFEKPSFPGPGCGDKYRVALDTALENLKTIQRSLNFTNV